MEKLALITRALKTVSTYGQARAAIGETLRALGSAFRLPSLSAGLVRELNARRLPLEVWYKEIATAPAGGAYSGVAASMGGARILSARAGGIVAAYTSIAGAEGESGRRIAVSFGDELIRSAANAPKLIGETIGDVVGGAAGVVGDAAGGLAGGILKGIWPVVLIALVILIVAGNKRAQLIGAAAGVLR